MFDCYASDARFFMLCLIVTLVIHAFFVLFLIVKLVMRAFFVWCLIVALVMRAIFVFVFYFYVSNSRFLVFYLILTFVMPTFLFCV